MLVSDFSKHNIINFTPQEITSTGAKLVDVSVETIIAAQKFREYIRRKVKLLPNGITTGEHKSLAHKLGYAVDVSLFPADGPVNIHYIFKGAIASGFFGIGIYWNQKQYSLHLEIKNKFRQDFAWWLGIKDPGKKIFDWQWFSLLRDPKSIQL